MSPRRGLMISATLVIRKDSQADSQQKTLFIKSEGCDFSSHPSLYVSGKRIYTSSCLLKCSYYLVVIPLEEVFLLSPNSSLLIGPPRPAFSHNSSLDKALELQLVIAFPQGVPSGKTYIV